MLQGRGVLENAAGRRVWSTGAGALERMQQTLEHDAEDPATQKEAARLQKRTTTDVRI